MTITPFRVKVACSYICLGLLFIFYFSLTPNSTSSSKSRGLRSDIVGFYHIFPSNDKFSMDIINEQVAHLTMSGLINSLSTVYYSTSYSHDVNLSHLSKFKKVTLDGIPGTKTETEQGTLWSLQNYCAKNPQSKVVYFHTMGSLPRSQEIDQLRYVSNCFTLNARCLSALRTHDICGWRVSPLPYLHIPGIARPHPESPVTNIDAMLRCREFFLGELQICVRTCFATVVQYGAR